LGRMIPFADSPAEPLYCTIPVFLVLLFFAHGDFPAIRHRSVFLGGLKENAFLGLHVGFCGICLLGSGENEENNNHLPMSVDRSDAPVRCAAVGESAHFGLSQGDDTPHRGGHADVRAGDTLLVVTAEALRSKKGHQQRLRTDYEAQHRDLEHLIAQNPEKVRSGLYQMEWSALRQKMAEMETQVALARKELDRSAILYGRRVISLAEHEKSAHQHERLERQRNSLREQQLAVWQSKKRELEQQIISLESDMASIEIEEENYIVKAPATGRVTNMQGFQTGNYLVQGQHIADISLDGPLVAECLVPTSAIGFIHPGQSVKFQIDTYHYHQWGMLEGRVRDINSNLLTNEQSGESFFIVRCQLDRDYLSLKNGFQARVGKGNTYTARFYLTDRTLWQLLFDRVDDWFNPNLRDKSG